MVTLLWPWNRDAEWYVTFTTAIAAIAVISVGVLYLVLLKPYRSSALRQARLLGQTSATAAPRHLDE